MLQLSGFTRENPFSVTARLTEALSSSGAWILHHQDFAGLALCINFEIDSADLPRLRTALSRTGLQLSDESLAALAAEPVAGQTLPGSFQALFLEPPPRL